MDVQGKRRALEVDGFCVIPGVLTRAMLDRTRGIVTEVLEAQSADHFEAQRSTGSMISVRTHSFFADLVTWEPALAALRALGIAEPRFTSGYVISKPPHSPPLFWHQDWGLWDDPLSYTEPTVQLFLMYYLVDTTPHNGCLRVLRGSHRRRHPMHDLVPTAHTDALRRATDPTHPAFQPIPEDQAVPVTAGDLVIGDARLLHGAFANDSDAWRTVITLWYHPFERYSARVQAYMAQSMSDYDQWSPDAQRKLRSLVPVYEGDQAPWPWNRVPGPELR